MAECYVQLQQLYQVPAAGTDAAATSSPIAVPYPKVLDTRPIHKYHQHRLLYAVNIQLPSLTTSCYLLPDKSECFAVIVPSSDDYTVVQEHSQQGLRLDQGSTAVYLKGATSVQDFLLTRGWAVACWLQDCPQLWQAAQQLQLIETQHSSKQLLARRCLFSPSQLLASNIGSIEQTLAARYLQQQATLDAQGLPQQEQHSPAAGGVAHLPQQQQVCELSRGWGSSPAGRVSTAAVPSIVLHALDLGCGSGRDLCWLAGRQHMVSLPACQQTSHHQQQQQQQAPVSWRVTGVDSWIGALERAHDLAAAMHLARQQVQLVVGSICAKSGDVLLQKLPPNSRLQTATHASVVHAGRQTSSEETNMAQAGRVGAEAAANGKTAAVSTAADPLISCFEAPHTYDLIVCVRFLERALLPRLKGMLKPGGFVLYSTFVDGPGLRAFGRPSGPEHVLQPGELAAKWLGPDQGFTVLQDDVMLTGDGREVCFFAAQLCL